MQRKGEEKRWGAPAQLPGGGREKKGETTVPTIQTRKKGKGGEGT